MPVPTGLDELARAAEKESDRWQDVEKATRLTHEAKWKQLEAGWDIATAAKGTRYGMRAAGLYMLRKELKAALKKAKKVRKDGETGRELHPVREAQFAVRMEAVRDVFARIQAFKAHPWGEKRADGERLEASHKQRPAKDAELVAFYAAAERSTYRTAFLVAEFGGVRGAEFGDHGQGVRVEVGRKEGEPCLRFFIQSAKADGDQKGLDMRCVESVFPSGATPEVQRRWLELAKKVTDSKKSLVVKIDYGKPKKAKPGEEPKSPSTPGQLFTQACKNVAKTAKVHVAAYSFRHRFSAQVKAANPGDAEAVALALGHQTTETQRHYARATRGGGGISPTRVVGVNVSGQKVRGAPRRSGPPLEIKEKVAIGNATPRAPNRKPRAPRGPRL